MTQTFRKTGIGCLLLVLLFSGCKLDLANTSWDVDVLAPVITTRLTLADLLADSLLTADSEGALRLKINTPLIDLPLDSILKIPDTTLSKVIFLPLPLNDIAPGFELPIPLVDQTRFDLGDIALKKVKLRRGKLKLKVKSTLGTGIDFRYQIPLASQFGTPFEASESLEAGSSTDTTFAQFEFDLTGYEVDLRGTEGSGFNTLVTSFVIKTATDGSIVSIPALQPFFFLEYSFVDLLLEYGSGYFGQQSSSVENEVTRIDFLDKITEGQMFLDSVTIALNVSNGVGADARFRLDELKSINSRQNNTVSLNHAIVGNTLLLTRAIDPNGNAADVIASERHFVLDNSNSNIKPFIENLPNQLGFTFHFDLNPLGNVSSGNDFFYYDRPFKAILDIDIPLRTTLTNLTLVDTLDFNLSEIGVVESVNSGSFTLVAKNGLPMEAMMELILLDEFSMELDTLLVPSTIAAPALDANNKVIAPRESRILIPIPNKTSNVLPRTRKVRILARFNTANQPNLVELYDYYGIDVKLIGNFNLNFSPSAL